MYDFEIKIPTEIYFGTNVEEKSGALMKKYGDKIMIIYGSERIFKTGLGENIVENLKKSGCEVVLCGGVKPNAKVSFIREAIKKAREHKVDGILAIGGGSTIDTSKAVAAGIFAEEDIMDIYKGNVIPKKFLPIGTIVTVPATASESNGMSVISCDETGEKIAWFSDGSKPKFALLNPELTLTLSLYQTAVGGFDTFSHAFERYFDMTRNSRVFDAMTTGVMKTVVKLLPRVIENPSSVNLRSELMLAASVAHNDMLGPGGDFGCHQISHEITKSYGVAHGGALAMIIPAWCEYMRDKNKQRFVEFFTEVFNINADGCTEDQIIDKGITKMKSFITNIGLSLQINIDCDECSLLAENITKPLGFIGGNFEKLDKLDVENILKKIVIVA